MQGIASHWAAKGALEGGGEKDAEKLRQKRMVPVSRSYNKTSDVNRRQYSRILLNQKEIRAMTDATGHMNRPGAGPSYYSLSLNGIPINHYINHNPQTGRVEIVKPMPPGVDDWLVKDFADEGSARAWATLEFNAGRLG